jgi:predicted LPLAT superfamily acyltransferase
LAHWADEKEKGSGYWQLKLMLGLRRVLGRGLMSAALRPVVLVFYLVSGRGRAASRAFLERAAASAGRPAPKRRDSFRHFLSFAEALLDKIDAWSGSIGLSALRFREDSVGPLVEDLRAGKGAVILCSHLGNAELLRALASFDVGEGMAIEGFSFVSIVEFAGTAKFNRLLAEIDPRSMGKLIPASDVGPDTVIMLKETVDSGGLVVIAGDRVAAGNRDRVVGLGFLGEEAGFPLGPFVLADLLEVPAYFMTALRDRDLDFRSPYAFYVERASTATGGGRRGREERARELAAEYASVLARQAALHPYQWYNFYDFWEREA